MDIIVDNFQFLERKADSDRAANIGGGGGSSWDDGSGSVPSLGGLWRDGNMR